MPRFRTALVSLVLVASMGLPAVAVSRELDDAPGAHASRSHSEAAHGDLLTRSSWSRKGLTS